MDELDKKLLDVIQTGFPLDERPYAILGEQLGLPEEEVLKRVQALYDAGIIRRIGANFQSAKLGWVSTLCAAKVPQEKLQAFIERINAEPGVTHNYERQHEYNIWFTLISPSRTSEQETLENISRETGLKILNLPATRLYKIRVDFSMQQ